MSGYIDIHCHILPRLDDGAKDLDMATAMLKQAYDEGIRAIIATPHYNEPYYKIPPEKIYDRIEELMSVLKEPLSDMRLFPGNEIRYSMSALDALCDGRVFTLAGSNYVLIEFSMEDSYSYIRNSIYQVMAEGYIPIIAHAERCANLSVDNIYDVVDMGAYIQINAGSITGENGFLAKRHCKKLMKADLIDFIGTDSHRNDRRSPKLKACAKALVNFGGNEYVKRLLYDNPMHILNNTELP